MSEPSGLIPIGQAARLLMISDERIRQLQKQGYIPRAPKRGVVPLVGAVQGYLRYLREDERQSSKSAAANRVTDARTREIELRIAERQRDLIPQDDARAVIGEMAAMVKAEFVGSPARVTRDLDLRRTLEQDVDASFARLAVSAERARTALASGGRDLEAEPEV